MAPRGDLPLPSPTHPAPDLATPRDRELTQSPGRVRELGVGGHLHARPLPLSEHEEGKERAGDALLSCGATDGRTP